MMLAALFALLSCAATVYASDPVRPGIDSCCHLLKAQFPDKTLLADAASTSSYHALQQAEMAPVCRIYAVSASDVSAIVKMAGEERCHFAVRSGGHMSWEGASNIGPDGFVIDLGKMKNISTNEDNSVVSVEPGLVAIEVYRFLDPLNITAPVARVADVGVGGFLLGGGLSFFTSTTGFANNHVVNYEVVLADGSIVNANANSETELYYALKFGSTNYGIVTRFDLTTFELPPVCTGLHEYSIDKLEDLAHAAVEFLDQPPQTPNIFILVVGWDSVHNHYGAFHVYTHSCAQGKDQLFKWVESRFSEIAEFVDDGPIASSGISDFVQVLKDTILSSGSRMKWGTTTLHNANADLIIDISDLIITTFAPLHALGLRESFYYQPFPGESFLAGQSPQGNPSTSTFESEKGGLGVVLLTVEWDDPSQDVVAETLARGVHAKIEALAEKRGMLHPWLYLNYADSHQAVYERSVSKETLSRLARVKKQYDPNQIFSKYWRGGFKIQDEKAVDDASNPRPVDEL